MIDPQLRPLISIGLVVASACAAEDGQGPAHAAVSNPVSADAELFSQTWTYVHTRIKDGERSSMPTVHELQFQIDETSNAWMAITAIRHGGGEVRVDTTMIDPDDLSPLRSRTYGEINDRWRLITESQWQNDGLVVARTVWPDGEQNSVEVSVPDGAPIITGLAHTALRFQRLPLHANWRGSFRAPSITGTAFQVLHFAVIGETDMVGAGSTRVPVWMVSVGLNERPLVEYLVAKDSGRLMGYRVPFRQGLVDEVALVGWSSEVTN